MIIKVTTDANVAIIITTFLSSSGGFRLNGLSEPLFVAIVEGTETLLDAIVESRELLLVVVTAVVVAIVVVVLGVCVVDAKLVIGS